MDPKRKQTLLGAAMVALGLVQAGYGSLAGDFVYAGLGFAYSLCGVGFLSEADVL